MQLTSLSFAGLPVGAADVPRIPEHCVQYALILLWPKLLSFTSPDKYQMAEKPKDYDEKANGGKEWEPPSAVKLDKGERHSMSIAKAGVRPSTHLFVGWLL